MTTPYDMKQTDRASLELLYTISRELTSALDLRTVLQRVLVLSMANTGAINGSLIVLDEHGEPFESIIIVGKQVIENTTEQLKGILEKGLAGWVVRNNQGALLADTSQDERWLRRPDDDASRTGAKSAISVPLVVREQLAGVMTLVHPTPNTFTRQHLDLLQAIADQAGIAVLNARLYDESQRRAQVMTDLAERAQAAQRRYQELFEDSVDSILMTNWDGHILESNRQTEIISGYLMDDLLGMLVGQLHLIDHEKVGVKFEKLRSGETVSYESELHTQRGNQIPIQVHARSVIIEGETNLQWILRDITERRNLDRLRDDLISMIYHDLRSPLSNIVSSLDVFNSMLPADGDPAYGSLLNIALRSTERIQRLTNSLLDMNRLESGQPIVNRFSTSLHLLAKDVVDAVSVTAENKNLNIQLLIPSDIPLVIVDADMIRRVLINLLDNAVKFTPSGGEITLEASEIGPWAQIVVQDSGPGIPAGDQERIFDKYTRLNPGDKVKGFGLGLAYCRLAVEGHGGKIWVESQPGQGSRFCLTLPIA